MPDKQKKNVKSSSKAAPKKSASKAPFTTADASEAYRHFLSEAEGLSADEVPVRGGDTAIARRNIERGVEAIRPHIDTLPSLLPKISGKALLELPSLALALLHADGRVPHAVSAGEIDAALAKVGPLRELTLSYLEIVAVLGLVPEGRVRAIRAGKGKLDNARDCVDIAGVFKEFESALAGKHPFTPEQLGELSTTGTRLVQAITPRGTIKAPAARDPAALIRDRFWKLVEDGHNDLRTAGVALFGIKNVDEHVPPLLSRHVVTASKNAASDAASVPEPAADQAP